MKRLGFLEDVVNFLEEAGGANPLKVFPAVVALGALKEVEALLRGREIRVNEFLVLLQQIQEYLLKFLAVRQRLAYQLFVEQLTEFLLG